jgi:hypothetical protein
MTYIEIVRPNGTCYTTSEKVGTAAETDLFRVITERWGKIFFTSEEGYNKWCAKGRERNETTGFIANATYHLDTAFEDATDAVVIEAYTV